MIPIFARINELFRERVVKTVFQHWTFRSAMLGFIIFLATFFVLIIDVVPGKVDVQLGEESKIEIKAPRAVENRVRTEELRKQAGLRIVAEAPGLDEYYRISTTTAINVTETAKAIFKEMKSLAIKREQLEDQYLDSDISVFAARLETDYDVRIPRAFIDSILELPIDSIESIEKQRASGKREGTYWPYCHERVLATGNIKRRVRIAKELIQCQGLAGRADKFTQGLEFLT